MKVGRGLEFGKEFSKNIIITFWTAKIKSFQNTNLSDIDSQKYEK
jgi:hypothetical protein